MTEAHPLIPDYERDEYAGLKARRRAESRFRNYGRTAIIIAGLFLSSLLVTIVGNGTSAFHTTEIQLAVHLEAKSVERNNFRSIARNSLFDTFPEVESRKEKRSLNTLISSGAGSIIRDYAEKNPDAVGTVAYLWLPASSVVDQYIKHGNIASSKFGEREQGWVNSLEESGAIRSVFNTTFFTAADSREPELAGIWGAIMGSWYVIVVCMIIAFPIGVAAAIYLQEFAPKNRFTDIIELNINNLAAVPSIVFGLLALEIFLNVGNMPRSTPLVGGLTLAMLVLPIMVITTRNALEAVPPSIREAARGLGASPVQVVFHHVLPAGLPGIMTGAILAIARALGETAPLLMIGMVAFIADTPHAMTDPSSALPVQIYLWSDSPEPGFQEKTAGAIIVLLVFLLFANSLASYIRKKSELSW